MFPRKRLIAAGLATLLVSVAVTFPAAVAYSWFAPPQLLLTGVNGTIWHGRATAGTVSGFHINNIEWQFKPLALFTGKMAFETHSEPASGYLDTGVAISALGSVHLSDLSASLPLQAFQNFYQLQGFEGQLNLQFDQLTIADGIPTEASGTMTLSRLTARSLSPAPIGDFRADFDSDNSGVRALVTSESGVLDVDGTLTIGADRSYSLAGQVGTSAATPPGLQQQLRYLGTPDAAGKRDFRIEGSL